MVNVVAIVVAIVFMVNTTVLILTIESSSVVKLCSYECCVSWLDLSGSKSGKVKLVRSPVRGILSFVFVLFVKKMKKKEGLDLTKQQVPRFT